MTQIKPYLLLLGRIFLGLVFIYAGYAKLMDPPQNFQGLLSEYTIIPRVFIPWIVMILPWLELTAGIFLILGLFTQPCALFLSGMSLALIIVLILSKIVLGISPLSCGCFGEGGIQLTIFQVMVLDVFDCFLGWILFKTKMHFLSLDERLSRV